MSSAATDALQNLSGTIVLAGAGKMGGAMLAGWLAGGLDAKRAVVIEPMPSDEINALAAKAFASTRRPRISAPSKRWSQPSNRNRFARPGQS